MKLRFKKFYTTDRERYRVVKEEAYSDHRGKLMCMNCRKLIYNRLLRGPFCAKHLTPVKWFEVCAYFRPGWGKKL